MCLAVPGVLIKKDGLAAEADFGGAVRKISLALVPAAKKGDYVLVHAGFAIQILKKTDARKTLRLLKEMYK